MTATFKLLKNGKQQKQKCTKKTQNKTKTKGNENTFNQK
jgi:hypothetical protein